MKKFLIYFVVVLLVSCGNNDTDKSTSNTAVAKTEVKDPEAKKGLDLINKSDCFTCHKLTETAIGPPYAAVAKKYKVLNEATMDSLVTQIIHGGHGKWGNLTMQPHPTITTAEAQSMAHYIMSIKE